MGLGLLLFLPVHGQVIIQDRYFMTAILFTAYVYAAALLANSYWPHLADKNLEYASEWIRMGFLPAFIVAFWLAQKAKLISRVFILATIGLFLRIARYFDPTLIPAYLSGQTRANFGIFINPFALFCATLLLFFLMTAPNYKRWWQKGLWFLSVLVLLEAIIATQARQIWIIGVIIFPCLLFWRFRLAFHWFSRPSMIMATLLLIGMIVLISLNHRVIEKRLSEEQATIHAIFSAKLDTVPPTSLGLRIYALRLGVERFLEKPLFGFGPGMNHYLIDHSPYPVLQAMKIQHFHNAYMETLVALGIVGALFFMMQLYCWYQGIAQGKQNTFLDPGQALFLQGALLLFLLANLFDFHLGNYWGRFYVILLGGACYAPRLAPLWFHRP